jgi:hypothetical protein
LIDVELLIDIPDKWGILFAHRRRAGMKNPVHKQVQARKSKSNGKVTGISQAETGGKGIQ